MLEKNLLNLENDSYVLQNIEFRPGRLIRMIACKPLRKPVIGKLLFIHGVGSCLDIWRFQIEHFYRLGYECYAYDLIGHGASKIDLVKFASHIGPPAFDTLNYDQLKRGCFSTCDACIEDKWTRCLENACSFEEHVKDAIDIFNHFILRSTESSIEDKSSAKLPISIIGHSYGTNIAVKVSKIMENYVDYVILISGGAPYTEFINDKCDPNPTYTDFLEFPVCILTLLNPLITWVYRKIAFFDQKKYKKENYHEMMIVSSHSSAGKDDTFCLTKDDINASFNIKPSILRATIFAQTWPEGNDDYHSSIDLPILLLHGRYDNFVSEDDESLMRSILQRGVLRVIDRAAHMVMLDAPSEVNRCIEGFLAKPPPPNNIGTRKRMENRKFLDSSTSYLIESRSNDTSNICNEYVDSQFSENGVTLVLGSNYKDPTSSFRVRGSKQENFILSCVEHSIVISLDYFVISYQQ